MNQPVTTLTDIALALLGWWWAWRLFQLKPDQCSRLLWACGLVAQGAGALLGGMTHGFLSETTWPGPEIWMETLVCLGLASSLLAAGLGLAALSGKAARIWLVAVGFKLALYLAWLTTRNDFFPALCDQLLTMLLLVGLMRAGRARIPAVIPILSWGLAALFVGGVIQFMNIGLGRYIDHNVIYHIFGGLALWSFYRTGRLLRDAA